MADRFVRPDTSHNVTRDGLTYETAWGGWSEILWGAGEPPARVKAEDTLYVCGSFTFGANMLIGNHGATIDSRVTIRGDYPLAAGSITFSGAFYVDLNRSYTTLSSLTISSPNSACISPGGNPLRGAWIKNCIINCGTTAGINFRAFSGWSYEDCIIEGNSFNGGNAAAGSSAIQWYVTSAVISSLTRLQIKDNTFTNGIAQRATILLKPIQGNANPACTIIDLIVSGNTFSGNAGVAMEIYGFDTFGSNKGIKIYNNVISNQSISSATLGGGMSIGGFTTSDTVGFGSNDIYNNRGYNLAGITGFCNTFYGSYVIYNNYAEDLSSTTIDGCGVLLDHGCNGCTVYNNKFVRITGTGSNNYLAGFGVLILDALNCTVYSNVIDGCITGVAFGNALATQSSNVYNNSFLNCSNAGTYLVGGADPTTNNVRNNIFTATSGTAPSVKNNTTTWSLESNNCYYGFAIPSGHTLAGSSITTNPQLDERHGCASNVVKSKGVYIEDKNDFYNRPFQNPPIIGAVEEITKDLYRTLKGI